MLEGLLCDVLVEEGLGMLQKVVIFNTIQCNHSMHIYKMNESDHQNKTSMWDNLYVLFGFLGV